MTFVEGGKHFRCSLFLCNASNFINKKKKKKKCIKQRHVLRSPITQTNIPGEQVAYRQFPRPSPLPRRRGSARLARDAASRCIVRFEVRARAAFRLIVT